MPISSQLLKAEMAESEVRFIASRTKAARFPSYKDELATNFLSAIYFTAAINY